MTFLFPPPHRVHRPYKPVSVATLHPVPFCISCISSYPPPLLSLDPGRIYNMAVAQPFSSPLNGSLGPDAAGCRLTRRPGPQVGVEIKMLDDTQGNRDSVVVVHSVIPNGPAHKAGPSPFPPRPLCVFRGGGAEAVLVVSPANLFLSLLAGKISMGFFLLLPSVFFCSPPLAAFVPKKKALLCRLNFPPLHPLILLPDGEKGRVFLNHRTHIFGDSKQPRSVPLAPNICVDPAQLFGVQ